MYLTRDFRKKVYLGLILKYGRIIPLTCIDCDDITIIDVKVVEKNQVQCVVIVDGSDAIYRVKLLG